jgi:HPt (histidine-containing phosphotransfer) domain-containing protein
MIQVGEERREEDSDATVFHRPALALLYRLGGNKLVGEIIDVFSVSAPMQIAAARAGAESGDSDAIRRALHALKSSAGQLGALRMQQRCEEGEALSSKGPSAELSQLVLGLDAEYSVARQRLSEVRRNGLNGF